MAGGVEDDEADIGNCAHVIKVTFESVLQCQRGRTHASMRMRRQQITATSRVCSITLVPAHQKVKDSERTRTYLVSKLSQTSTSETGSEVEHGINSRSQDTSVSIRRIYPAADNHPKRRSSHRVFAPAIGSATCRKRAI